MITRQPGRNRTSLPTPAFYMLPPRQTTSHPASLIRFHAVHGYIPRYIHFIAAWFHFREVLASGMRPAADIPASEFFISARSFILRAHAQFQDSRDVLWGSLKSSVEGFAGTNDARWADLRWKTVPSGLSRWTVWIEEWDVLRFSLGDL